MHPRDGALAPAIYQLHHTLVGSGTLPVESHLEMEILHLGSSAHRSEISSAPYSWPKMHFDMVVKLLYLYLMPNVP